MCIECGHLCVLLCESNLGEMLPLVAQSSNIKWETMANKSFTKFKLREDVRNVRSHNGTPLTTDSRPKSVTNMYYLVQQTITQLMTASS